MQDKEASKPVVQFQVTLDEANLIFKALGQMPFSDVYALIGKLNEQANQQLQSPNQISNK